MTAQQAPARQMVPQAMRELHATLAWLTDSCCRECLNDEYAELCREMIALLCRKRPSPLLSGSLDVWAATIVHVIGSVNFLFDPTQTPHMTAGEIAEGFGVARSSVANKAAQLRRLLKVRPLDTRWCLPSRLAHHPLA